MHSLEFIQENIPLAGMTTFGIGGPARWLAQPSTRAEVVDTLAFAKKAGKPVMVLGGGSNLLVADSGVDAVVVKLAPGEFTAIQALEDDNLVWRVGAAVPLQSLVMAAVNEGVRGLEGLAGIPGRVGGAAAMNSGGSDEGLGAYIETAEAYDPMTGEYRVLTGDELQFSYRTSNVKGLLAVAFTLVFSERGDPERLTARMREYRERKKAAQPLMVPSAGCVFRNPQGDSAGSLLDAAGCKLMREGGAQVSGLHANFIINHGRATSGDVARLAVRMRDAVYQASGILLEPEVMLWGEDPAFDLLRQPPR
ncbi:MAG: UDP-N-acetylmuramate dehydrogenase [Planctomycetaceae bacterium]|nr:UDP-N-acetylmuramate dehydrogenase [Planctomycetaceae bacterium]